jgi:hypothetical protein
MSDPNIQSIIAFGVVILLAAVGYAARRAMRGKKTDQDRTNATGDLF